MPCIVHTRCILYCIHRYAVVSGRDYIISECTSFFLSGVFPVESLKMKLILLFFLFFTLSLFSAEITGKVIKISDGDTITIIDSNLNYLKPMLYLRHSFFYFNNKKEFSRNRKLLNEITLHKKGSLNKLPLKKKAFFPANAFLCRVSLYTVHSCFVFAGYAVVSVLRGANWNAPLFFNQVYSLWNP